jgi:molybdopterin synthase catalytic subunit
MQFQGEEFFKDRRERFMQAMDGGIAVFPGMVRQDDGLRNEWCMAGF